MMGSEGRVGMVMFVVRRLPRVLVRRGARGLVSCVRYQLRACILLSVLVLLLLLLLTRHSTADLWHTLDYASCLMGIRSIMANKHVENKANIFPLELTWSDDSRCLPLPTVPSPYICIHPIEIDRYISGAILEGSVWEVETVRLFQELLRGDVRLGVVDVGANIGQYSLLAASMGRPVVAVEPYIKHVRMIHKALVLSHLTHNFTLIHNAVSDSNRIVSLQFKKDNRGAIRIVESNSRLHGGLLRQPGEGCSPSETSAWTITMNDLLPHIGFRRAVLKMDIEGHEVQAMLRSGLLMEKMYVPYVLMEWVFLGRARDEYQVLSVQELVDYMMKYDYLAYSTTRRPLNMSTWQRWPHDVVWKLSTVTF